MTTYYFAAETGSDANDGLSTSAPKQTISAAGALIAAGNQIKWKCGERAAFTASSGWSINDKALGSECIIGYWNDDVSPYKPLFDGGVYLTSSDDANWTHTGSGVWTKTFTATVSRIFAGTTVASVKTGSWGQPMSKKSAAASVTGELQYHVDGSFVVTIYTGSTTVAPPSHYSGLCVLGNGVATSAGIVLRRCQNITFDHIQVAHSLQCFNLLTDGTRDCLNVHFKDCEAHAPHRGGNGFFLTNNSDLTYYVLDSDLLRCIAHNHTGTSENDANSGNWASNNGIYLFGRVKGCDIVDPIIRGGFRHTSLQIQNDGTTTLYVGENAHVYRTRSDMGLIISESDYEHPIDCNITNWTIEGLEVRNSITRSQFGGSGTLRGVNFIACRQATHAQNIDTDQVLMFQNWTSPDYRSVGAITVTGCTIENPYGEPIRMSEDRTAHTTGATWATNALTFTGNRIIDLSPGGGRTYSVFHHVSGTPFQAADTDTFSNNIFVTALTTAVRHEEADGVFTSRDVTTSAGSYSSSGNVRVASTALAGLVPRVYG